MNPLSTAEISSERAEINSIFDIDCTINTRTDTRGSAGGTKPTYTSTATKCRIFPLSVNETLYADKLQGRTGWMVIMPYDTVITSQDTISVDSSDYEIVGITYNSSPVLYKRAICTEII